MFSSFLLVGLLTVPVRAASCSLAPYWAQIRYCAAVDWTALGLRLVRDWEEIDPHQKTVLSDDWGVAFTTYWLARRLGYVSFCDGRYFIDRLVGLGLAWVETPPGRRGTYKSPDFIFEDADGKFHIVECKGTQDSPRALMSQLQRGRAQKRNVLFPAEDRQVAQRLVAGLYIARGNAGARSMLAISDPSPEEHGSIVRISHSVDAAQLGDPLRRAELARALQLAGAPAIAEELIKAPASRDEIAERREKFWGALQEFRRLAHVVSEHQGGWWGRRQEVSFPEPVEISRMRYRSAVVSYGVKDHVLEHLQEYQPAAHTLPEQFPAIEPQRSVWWFDERENSATVVYGDQFRAEITLRE